MINNLTCLYTAPHGSQRPSKGKNELVLSLETPQRGVEIRRGGSVEGLLYPGGVGASMDKAA